MNLQMREIDSLAEMQERLRHDERSIVLGGKDEATKQFFVCPTSHCTIGICSQGHGIKPATITDETGETIWAGYNSSVALVDTQTCETPFAVALDGVFYCFLDLMQDGSIIAIHELGACRIGTSGTVIWDVPTDIVCGFDNETNVIRIRTDEEEYVIEKNSGRMRTTKL